MPPFRRPAPEYSRWNKLFINNRVSILCFATAISLFVAKLATAVLNPSRLLTGVFTRLIVLGVVFLLLAVGWKKCVIWPA